MPWLPSDSSLDCESDKPKGQEERYSAQAKAAKGGEGVQVGSAGGACCEPTCSSCKNQSEFVHKVELMVAVPPTTADGGALALGPGPGLRFSSEKNIFAPGKRSNRISRLHSRRPQIRDL